METGSGQSPSHDEAKQTLHQLAFMSDEPCESYGNVMLPKALAHPGGAERDPTTA